MNNTKKKTELTFTSGSLVSALLRFAGPFMLGILVQNLYGAVDLMVVGQYATTADVSAVSVGSQIMNLATQLIIGFATGITILVGRDYGAKDYHRLKKVIGTALYLFSGIGIVLTVLYVVGGPHFIEMAQTPQEAVNATRSYLFICALGIPFITGYNIISSILTGMGNSKTPFIFIVIACCINITLDLVLVSVFDMGAAGAAVATTIAQAGSLIFALIFLKKKGLGFAFSIRETRFYKSSAGQLAQIGTPVAVQNVLVGLSFVFITAIINQMGLLESAAVGTVEKLITFLFVPATALSTSVSTACSQNLGANEPERAKKALLYGIVMALIPSAVICLYCQWFGGTLTALFTKDSQVIALGATYLRSYIFDIILVAFIFCMNGYFNSRGCSWFSLAHSLITTFTVRVPAAYLFSRLPNTSLYVIGWAAPLSTLASLILCIPFLIYLFRKN